MGFNLDDYEPVADRLDRFLKDHSSEAWVRTSIVHVDKESVTVKAEIGWLGDEVMASGHARGVFGLTGKSAQATSPLEDCETSAVGRALANAGYQTKGRASREEMARVLDTIPEPPVQGVNVLYLTDAMSPETKEAFKAGLKLNFPGIALHNLHPDLVESVNKLAVDVAAQTYAQPADTADLSDFGEEPF